jgi:hypothetical protein
MLYIITPLPGLFNPRLNNHPVLGSRAGRTWRGATADLVTSTAVHILARSTAAASCAYLWDICRIIRADVIIIQVINLAHTSDCLAKRITEIKFKWRG